MLQSKTHRPEQAWKLTVTARLCVIRAPPSPPHLKTRLHHVMIFHRPLSCLPNLGLVFECTALQDLRVSFAALLQQATTMKQFMWQPDLMRAAQFIDAGVRRMREI